MIEQEERTRDNPLYDSYVTYLSAFGVHVLRNIGREVGVARPAAKTKEVLISEIASVCSGLLKPIERSKRGAPVKEEAPDPAILQELSNIRMRYERKEKAIRQASTSFVLSSGDNKERISFIGTLVLGEDENRIEEDPTDKKTRCVLVTDKQVADLSLRHGDLIVCYVKIQEDGVAWLDRVVTVGSLSVGSYEKRKLFEQIPPEFPEELLFPYKKEICSVRIGKGQRALVVGEKKSDAYPFIQRVAKEIGLAKPAAPVFVILLDGRPEDVQYCKERIRDCIVFTAGMDATPEEKEYIVSLTLSRAKRVAELGYDSIVFFDSMPSYATTLAMLEGSADGWTKSPSPFVVRQLARVFSYGKNLRGAGTLTLFAFIDKRNPWSADIMPFLEEMENSHIVLREDGRKDDETLSYTLHDEDFE